MSKIRINDLARELEIKSKAVLDYLQEIDVTDKRSHSSALGDDLAERVRQHFRSTTLVEGPRESAPPALPALVSKPEVSAAAPSTPAAPSHAPAAVKKTFEFHIEPRAMTRSLDEIRESVRKAAVVPPPPPPVAVRPVE